MITAEEQAANKELIYRWIADGLGRGNTTIADEIISKDAELYDSLTSSIPHGREGAKRRIHVLHACFPGLSVDVANGSDLIAEGNRVAARLTMSGTHECTSCSTFSNVTSFTVTPIALYYLDNETITSWLIEGDDLTLLSLREEGGLSPAQALAGNAAKPSGEVFSDLEKLGKLRAQELLTQKEFEVYKKVLLRKL